MKIEKITENKIRIIIKPEDFKDKNIDIREVLKKSTTSQTLFTEILDYAKKEIGFDTDGYKVQIEGFSSLDDVFVFTITKILSPENEKIPSIQKKLIVKRKHINPKNKNTIYQFENFDIFCDFCKLLKDSNQINLRGLAQTSSLYIYKNTFYLILQNINTEHKSINKFYSYISEFARNSPFSETFIQKLKEHGSIVMKKSALTTGIKYFAK